MGRLHGFMGSNSIWVILILLAVMGATPINASMMVVIGGINASLYYELYSKHCQDFVPAPKAVIREGGFLKEEAEALSFYQGWYEGGGSIFNQSALTRSSFVSFSISDVWQTEQEDVLRIKGRLTVHSGTAAINRRFQRPPSHFRPAGPSRSMPRGRVFAIFAQGFHSNSSQSKMCTVGLAHRYFVNSSHTTFLASTKFSYPKTSTLVSNLINGTIESLDREKLFEPISIYAKYDRFYEYTRVDDAIRVCSVKKPLQVLYTNKHILNSGSSVCNLDWLRRPLDVFWNPGCSGRDCSPFNVSQRESLPNTVFVEKLKCTTQGQVRGYFRFSNLWNSGFMFTLPETILIGEGEWDAERDQLCMVACHIENGGNVLSEEEDCGISISMQFPMALTVVDRYMVVRHVESKKGNFKNFTFKGPTGIDGGMGNITNLPIVQYKYTKLDQVSKVCNKTFTGSEMSSVRWYPNGSSFGDLAFDVAIENSGNLRMQGHAYPFTIVNRFERDMQLPAKDGFNPGGAPLNVSFNLKFEMPVGPGTSFVHVSTISAEGIYNPLTGSVCMIGCRHVGSKNIEGDMDCEIHIMVNYASLNPELYSDISGSIKSLRSQKDPHYFKPMKLSSTSIYKDHVEKSTWRNDLEIIMGLVSLSLTTVVIYTQLLHIRRRPNIQLLQLVSTARLAVPHAKTAWFWETKVLCIAFGGLIAYLLHHLSGASHSESRYFFLNMNNNEALWQNFRAYAGIILDGFLLPQILVNFFSDTKMIILVPYFYIGITLARSIPHVYDACRVIPLYSSSYFYAIPDLDFYSTAWDIVIDFGALPLALIVFLQQRFGGRCISPSKFKKFL
eukprot:PITA_25213